MPFKRSSMRYAHTNGHTSLAYTESGEYIITCGSDGDIRKWKGIDDDDPSSNCLGEFVVCIAYYGERLLASTDLNTVQAYTFPDIDRDGTEMRFTAQATCIRVNKKFIVAGSEDTCIKVITKDKSEDEFQLDGHTGPIIAIDISCKNILASISGDGCMKIWDLNDKKELKTITGFPKLKTFEDAKCFGTPSFEPVNGNSLAYAKGKEVIVLNTKSWEVQFELTDDQVTSDYSCCQFSADGQFIAAGTRIGELSVFNFMRKQSINCETNSDECHGITAIAWNPMNNKEVAFCDSTGQLGTIVSGGGVSSGSVDFLDNAAMEDADCGGDDFDGITFQDEGDGEGDAENENCISLEQLKNETMKLNGVHVGDENVDDEQSKDSFNRRSVSIDERPVGKIYKQLEPFQPSSTPSDLEHRYLVWNNVGIVRAHSDGDGDGSIDVEFHDASVHHSLHMTNYNNHTMASLSSSVLALSGESSNKLICIALAASGNKEWSVEMPDCEGVLALTATTKLVAVTTDMRYLRIFSVMGTQREVISIPGPVLAMAGFHDRLMVCYHSAPASEDQHLSALLLQTIGLTVRTREIRIPLLRGRKMTWLGYSDCGSPVFADNMGIVQMYSMKTGCWYPICDTMKQSQSVSNNFFVIDVSERTQIIQAVLCRGCSYPMTNPRPMMTELQMQVPVCDIETEKSTIEETLIRCSNFSVDNAEKTIKELAIKLFSIACRAELEARAKELIEMIASPALLPTAMKYASKSGRIHLADKLAELLPQMEEQSKEREKELQENETDALGIIQNSPLNATLLLMNSVKAYGTTSTTPKIAPKPMVLSNQKRNPFKRSALSTTPNVAKNVSISILQDKKIDFELGSTQNSSLMADNDSVIGDSQEPDSSNGHPPGKNNFMSWFAKNKAELQKKHPDANTTELTKIGMRQFKATSSLSTSSLSSPASDTNPFAVKRKVDDVDASPPPTASSNSKISAFTAKLARFDFKKQT